MAISQVGLNSMFVSQAYGQAVLFDKMRQQKEEPAASAAVPSAAETESKETVIVSDGLVREKPKPNTVPFKPGFAFEYAQGSENGPVTVSITDTEKIKVEMKESADSETRKKTIRSLVMLGIGKLDRTDFNALFAQGKNTVEGVSQELTQMGLNPAIPFGLGDASYYFNGQGTFSTYQPLDIKG